MKLNTEGFNKNLNEAQKTKFNAQISKGNEQSPDQIAASPAADIDINTLYFNRLSEYEVMNEVSKHNLCKI